MVELGVSAVQAFGSSNWSFASPAAGPEGGAAGAPPSGVVPREEIGPIPGSGAGALAGAAGGGRGGGGGGGGGGAGVCAGWSDVFGIGSCFPPQAMPVAARRRIGSRAERRFIVRVLGVEGRGEDYHPPCPPFR